MSEIEREVVPCIIDQELDCPTNCKYRTISFSEINSAARAKRMPFEEFTEGLRQNLAAQTLEYREQRSRRRKFDLLNFKQDPMDCRNIVLIESLSS